MAHESAADSGDAPRLIDSHAHLASRQLQSDLDGVIARALAEGVIGIVSLGTTAEDSRETVDLTRRFPMVGAGVGIHPNDAAEAGPNDWAAIEELSLEQGVVAIGETGLDRHWDRTPFALQQEFFDRHLELAQRRDLPVVVHCRKCESDIITQLERQGRPITGVLHSFSGTQDDARAFLALGLHISFAGMVTYQNKNLEDLRKVAEVVPIERLLVETDSPYLSPHPHRGQRNEPARVRITAAVIAELRGISLESFASATTQNARRLFRRLAP